MKLGIEGRYAVVCASSRGIGKACARSLAEAGCVVVINGRDEASLTATAAELQRETAQDGGTIIPVVADVGTTAGRAKLLAAVPQVDILVNNNGGPPFKSFASLTHDGILAGLEGNLVTPVELVQAVLPGMVARKFGRIVSVTSSSVKAPVAGLDLSSGARAGLTAFLAGVAREVVKHNVTMNFILPGRIATDRIDAMIADLSQRKNIDRAAAKKQIEDSIPAGRIGEPREMGEACAFFCGVHAGYITGQSLLIDGGQFPGTM
jgi:3-oxoacyl-[acyl-carrier protein] reductase